MQIGIKFYYIFSDLFDFFLFRVGPQGFRKVVPDRWEFANDYFKRGEKGLLRDIQRRKISPSAPSAACPAAAAVTVAAVSVVARTVSPANSGDEQVISSNSSPVAQATAGVVPRSSSCITTPELREENERLRKENTQLNHELTQLRGLCNNILALMTNYSSGHLDGSVGVPIPEGKPLELLPAKQVTVTEDTVVGGESQKADEEEGEEETTPRLFGVSIRAKRVRREEEEEAEEEEPEVRQGRNGENGENSQERESGSDVRPEPLDGNSDHQEPRWLELGQ